MQRTFSTQTVGTFYPLVLQSNIVAFIFRHFPSLFINCLTKASVFVYIGAYITVAAANIDLLRYHIQSQHEYTFQKAR